MSHRVRAHEDGAWAREAASAYAQKQVEKQVEKQLVRTEGAA
jgi:ring-1,2-phenylacetyl-CoA epoxidase subunit PaaA